MISTSHFEQAVTRGNLAPSVHNTQPARWRLADEYIEIAADLDVRLEAGDPHLQDAGLSCGAAAEATVLALGNLGFGADFHDLWLEEDCRSWPGHRMAARLSLRDGTLDPLASELENRFTWRAAFSDDIPDISSWIRPDTALVTDTVTRSWLADRNDWASLQIMQDKPFRRELLSWMRLSDSHPRAPYDGLGRAALQMPSAAARFVGLALGPLWPVLSFLHLTKGMTAEAKVTRTAPVIACFHRDLAESPVTAGRQYLRLCLEATHMGLAGWPMAALSDHPETSEEIKSRLAIPPGRRLVQVIRFGKPTDTAPPRARRPLEELI